MQAAHETGPNPNHGRGGFAPRRGSKPVGTTTVPAHGFRHHHSRRLQFAHDHAATAERRSARLCVEGLDAVFARMEPHLPWRVGTWPVGKRPLPARSRATGSSPSELAQRNRIVLHDWRVLRQTKLTDYECGNRHRLNGLGFMGSSLFYGTVFCRRSSRSRTRANTRTSPLQETKT